MTITKGYGIMNHTFQRISSLYVAVDQVGERKLGVLVSMETWKSYCLCSWTT